jgi:hypothetical protein
MKKYTPYTYLLGWTKLNKWYYGSRTAKAHKVLYDTGCHPDDLFVSYFSSSVVVKEYIANYGVPDIIQVRKTFFNAEDCKAWEHKVLSKLYKHRNFWINKRFDTAKYVTDSISVQNNIKAKKSRTQKEQLVVSRNISKAVKLAHSNMSEETKKRKSEKIRQNNLNMPTETRQKIADSVSKHYNSLSQSEKEAIIEKRKITFQKNKELGLHRRICGISCLCCRHYYSNKKDFIMHIRKIAK